jgi:hypothetical protein
MVADIRETNELRGDVAFGVETLEIARLVDPGNIELLELIGNRNGYLPFDIQEALIIAQLRVQLLLGDVEQLRHGGKPGRIDIVGYIASVGPDRTHCQAGGEEQSIPVGDLAAHCRQRQCVLEADVPLLQIKPVA